MQTSTTLPERRDATTRPISATACWCFVGAGIVLSGLTLFEANDSVRSFVFDALGLIAAGGAVYGVVRNRPAARVAWLLLVAGLFLLVAGDLAYDVVANAGSGSGHPWADLLYAPAYLFIASALLILTRKHFQRDTTVDSVIVALAASAVIWQWVITPLLTTSEGATFERVVAAAYPILDVILVVALAHAVFTLPRWIPAAWLLFGGLTVMLVADTLYARLIADGTYTDGSALDMLWPVAYFLLAGAVLHPSMRSLWFRRDTGLVRQGRARMIVLAAALFSAPAVLILDDATSGEAVALTAIVGVTAALIAWRIARLVSETDRAREVLTESDARFRTFVQHATDAVGVLDASGAIIYVTPSVDDILRYEPQALIGRKLADLVHPDDADQVVRALATLSASPLAVESIVVRLGRADGSWRWIEATGTNQLHEPAVRGIVGNFHDITDRKRIETFASQETQVLELVLNGAPIPETCEALLRAVEEFVGDASVSIRLLGTDTAASPAIASPTLSSSLVDAIESSWSVASDADSQSRLQPVVVTDIENRDRYPELHRLYELAGAHGIRAFWSVPIRTADDGPSLGMLAIYVHTPRGPTAAEQAMMERVRSLVGIAVDRAAKSQAARASRAPRHPHRPPEPRARGHAARRRARRVSD